MYEPVQSSAIDIVLYALLSGSRALTSSLITLSFHETPIMLFAIFGEQHPVVSCWTCWSMSNSIEFEAWNINNFVIRPALLRQLWQHQQ